MILIYLQPVTSLGSIAPLLRKRQPRKIETWKSLGRWAGSQPREWNHNLGSRTSNLGVLTISVWVRIDTCQNCFQLSFGPKNNSISSQHHWEDIVDGASSHQLSLKLNLKLSHGQLPPLWLGCVWVLDITAYPVDATHDRVNAPGLVRGGLHRGHGQLPPLTFLRKVAWFFRSFSEDSTGSSTQSAIRLTNESRVLGWLILTNEKIVRG